MLVLQGYPDNFILLDNDSAMYKQMGNGVSVPVVKAVLSDFIKHNHIEEISKIKPNIEILTPFLEVEFTKVQENI